MNKLFLVVPYYFLNSIYGPLPALILLQTGKGPVEVGIAGALAGVAALLASLFWPKFVKIGEKLGFIVLGYLGIFLGMMLLRTGGIFVYFAAFILGFFPPAIYYALISHIKETMQLSAGISQLEALTHFSLAAGYVAAALLSTVMSPFQIAFLVAVLSVLFLFIFSRIFGEEGLLPLIDSGISELEELEARITGNIFRFDFLQKEDIPFMLTSFLFSASFGIIYPQLPTILKHVLGSAILIYPLTFVARIFTATGFFFSKNFGERALLPGVALRAAGFLALIFSLKYPPLIFLFYVLSGLSWSFIQFFYSYVALSKSEELVGINLFFRNLAYTIFTFLSGIFIKTLGFEKALILAFILFLLAPVPYLMATLRFGTTFLKTSVGEEDRGP